MRDPNNLHTSLLIFQCKFQALIFSPPSEYLKQFGRHFFSLDMYVCVKYQEVGEGNVPQSIANASVL